MSWIILVISLLTYLIIPFLVPATQTVSPSWKLPSSPPPFVPPLRETEEASRLNFPPEIKTYKYDTLWHGREGKLVPKVFKFLSNHFIIVASSKSLSTFIELWLVGSKKEGGVQNENIYSIKIFIYRRG